MIYERLWKSFDNDYVVHSVQHEDYTDPVLWSSPEDGYWIEHTPKKVRADSKHIAE